MLQPPRVLPSNAPPLRSDDDYHQALNVLHEQSGNRQRLDFDSATESEQKYPSSILTENAYPVQHPPQQYQVPQLYHPQPQHRQLWRCGFGRGGRYSTHGPEDDAREAARLRFESDRLYHRFRMSEQYVKYRDRQSKDDKGNGDQKWPDHLEKAFFYALVKYQPMGRRKWLHKDKQRGRNELIADCIEELTGEARTRKQVSSHIQVLKPFVENDPLIMRWLSKEDMGGGRHYPGGAAYPSGRRMSKYPVMTPPQAVRTGMLASSRLDAFRLQKIKGDLDLFQPTDFQMFVQRKHRVSDTQEEVQRLHTYTHSVSNPLGEVLEFSDWNPVNRDFPLLGTMATRQPLDCNVLVAEASLAFPLETWKEKDGVELGISFVCHSRHLAPSSMPSSSRSSMSYIKVHNTFYENGEFLKDHSGSSEARLEQSERGDGVETQIKFGSTFWARTLGRLAMRLLDTTKNHRQDVADSLRAITAIQEIYTPTDQSNERILVIHWTFRHSSATKGRASWRQLRLPCSPIVFNPPVKPERNDSMCDYNSNLTEESAIQHHQQEQSHSQPHPTLQSPFEYESSSGSALSSATWPTTISEGSFVGHQPPESHTEFAAGANGNFDFNATDLDIPYDSNLHLNFDNFDSSAFNFDVVDFGADPSLNEYSQQAWCDGYANGFDGQGIVDDAAAYSAHPDPGDGQGGYDGTQYDAQQGYDVPHDQQAYGGAGQELIKDEVALAALADASYLASTLITKQEPA